MKSLNIKMWSMIMILGLLTSSAFGQMTRRFSLANPTPGRPDYVDVIITDLDGDGNLDIYAMEESQVIGGTASLEVEDDQFMNDGNGILATSFTSETLYQEGLLYDNVNAGDAEAADFDGDGNMDIVRVSSKRIFVLYTDNNGDWDEAIQYNTTDANNDNGCSTNYVDVEIADFNDDGLPDFIVAQDNNCGCNPIFENDGNRTFTRHCNSGDASNTKTVSAGDINCDGDMDILLGYSDKPKVLTGNGNFGFSSYYIVNNSPGFDYKVVVADFAHINTGGGCSGSSTNSGLDFYVVWNNNVNGKSKHKAYKKESFGYSVKWSNTFTWLASDARFERDRATNAEGLKDNNKTEYIVLGATSSNMTARRCTSGFNIINISSTFLSSKMSGAGMDFGDLDNDGDLDMVVASGSTVTIYENEYDEFTSPLPFDETVGFANAPHAEEMLVDLYPVPVTGTGIFQYEISENESPVLIELYDLSGTKVETIVQEVQNTGSYSQTFETAHLPAGIYVYRFSAGSVAQSGKMIISK